MVTVEAGLVAFVVSLVATLACERIGSRLGLVVRPREDRWHRRPVPLLGGVAIALGVMAGAILLPGDRIHFGMLLAVALAMAAVGLFDDVRTLTPQAKLVAQIILGGILIQLDFQLRLTGYAVLDVLLTLLWVAGVTNAFNLLDNMDGLAAGMAALAGGFRLSFFLLDGDATGAALAAALIGAVVGFLVRNFPPAKIFMGDAGSLFLGFLLSGLSLLPGQGYSRGIFAVLVLPVLLMLIPIFDTTFVTVTRLLTGRPVSQGGRDHTSHRLVALGITERRALAVLWGVSALAGGLAVLSYRYGFTYTVGLVALLVVWLVLLGIHLSRVQVVRPPTTPPDTAIVRVVEDFPFKRHVATVGLDLVLILIAYYTAYLLRFEDTFEVNRGGFVRSVAPVMVIQLAALALFGAYRGLWRYTGVRDLLRLLQAVTVGTAASVLYFVFVTRFEGLSRAVFVLDWLLLVLLVCGSRVSFRLLGEVLRRPPEGFRRVLIYGAGDGGELTLRELRNNPDLKREPVGFLDDDRAKIRTRIHGVPVLGDLEAVASLITTHRIDEVVVASRKIPPDRLKQMQAICTAQGISLVRASVRIE